MISLLLFLAVAQEPLPVPSEAAQKEAEKLVRDVFKDEYGRKALADRAALARTMLQKGGAKDDDGPTRYVLLREARELATQASDWETALKAADALGLGFKVDGLPLKESTLAGWTKAATTAAEMIKAARAQLAFADDAGKAGRFEAAEKAAAQAGALARKGRDLALAARADGAGKGLAERRIQVETLARARQTLETKPEDPEANLAVGRHECFAAGDWDSGLVKLSKGSDAALKALAFRDLASPEGADDRSKVGDAWWDLAEQQSPSVRLKMRERARVWYERARPELAGPAQARVGQRLADLRDDRFGGSWVDITDGKLFSRTSKPGEPLLLVPDEGMARRTFFSQPPPGEFDGLTVQMTLPKDWTGNGFVEFEEHTKSLAIYRPQRSVVLCTRPKDDTPWKVQKQIECPDGFQYVVTVMLRDGSYWFYLDGEEVGKLPAKVAKITEFNLMADRVPVSFDRIRLHRKE